MTRVPSTGDPAASEGLVVRIEARAWTVELDDVELPCSLKPSLFQTGSRVRNPVAVGDRVRVRKDGARGVIDEVLPRRNLLLRPTPGDQRVLIATASNIDLLVVVAATVDPPFRPGLVDRFFVAAELREMDPMLVMNKCDTGDRAAIDVATAIYREMGYPLLFTSARTGEGVDALRDALAGKTALFVGHSGVGKSSLMNALSPGLVLRTGVVAKHGRGRHTTTSVSLHRLPNKGHLVDSPGLREFGLVDVAPAELAILMPDLRPYAVDCKYPDCTHSHETAIDCSVRRAVAAGHVRPERYESYLRILESLGGDRERE